MKLQIFLSLLLISASFGENILVISLLASPSHYFWHKAYSLGLVQNGHNVTIVSHESDTEEIKNFTNILLEGVSDKLHSDFDLESLVSYGPFQSIQSVTDWELETCRLDFETKGLQTLMSYPESFKFDLIVWDFHSGKCLYPLIDKFGTPPRIATSPFGNQPFIGYVFGNQISSHIPFFLSYVTDDMDFYNRFFNFIYVHSFNLWRRYLHNPVEEGMAKQFFQKKISSFDEYERGFSLMLVNTDPIFNYPEALYPNTIPVAGLHIQPSKELPKDIKTVMEEAKHGVIFVAFGSNLDILNFHEKQKKALFDAFKLLPQTILIKSNGLYDQVPKNVIIKKWLPQNDILAHPNVKLIVTHGGALTVQEAMYHAVPILGIPFFLDQHSNMAKIDSRKLGKLVRFDDITSDLIYNSVLELINNNIYKENMRVRSAKIKDQPQTPLERAVFWTEYVLRHGGAMELSPSTRDKNIFERYDLDILAAFSVIISIIFLTLCIMYKIIYALLKTLFWSNQKVKRH